MCRVFMGVAAIPKRGEGLTEGYFASILTFTKTREIQAHFPICGGMPERPNGADLKSDDAKACGGSTPSPPVVVKTLGF